MHGGYVRDIQPAGRGVPGPQMLNDNGLFLLRLRDVAWERVVVPDCASRYCSQAGCLVKHISPR